MSARHRNEYGQTTVMIIGFVVVIAMMVVVVVDASAAYLQRQALSALADGAALAAADGIEGERVYTQGIGEDLEVDPLAAPVGVEAYLSSVGARERYPGLSYRVETSGDRVVVRLGAPLDIPLPLPGTPVRTHVTATAASVLSVDD